jgi:hypothetical protein
MQERMAFEIGEIGRDFFIKGPVEASVKPRGFNTWCRLPYPDHPIGCPNFGNKESCPPLALYFLDLYKPQVYVAFMQFAFNEYLNKKRERHPDWTERALRNPRHFQSHLDSGLKKFINSQLQNPEFKNWQALHSSEAMGVNIHLTAKNAGIELEWPPQKFMYRIALLTQTLDQE